MNWLESFKYIVDSLFNRNGYRGEVSPDIKPKKPEEPEEKSKPRADISLSDTDVAWEGIVWHHSATKDTTLDNWKSIVKYHTSYRMDGRIVSKEEFVKAKTDGVKAYYQSRWRAVGYHGGVEWVDGVLKYQKGRPLNMTGAHSGVAGVSNAFNKTYIGLCAVGNFDKEPPSQELLGEA